MSSLDTELDSVAQTLAGLQSTVASLSIPQEAKNSLLQVLRMSNILQTTRDVLAARAPSFELLKRVATTPENNIVLDGKQWSLANARMHALCGFIGIWWTVVDRVTFVASSVVCIRQAGATLDGGRLSNCVVRSRGEQTMPAAIRQVLQKSFAWPIAVGYAIRNIVLHEAACLADGSSIFKGDQGGDGLVLSEAGLTGIKHKAVGDRSDQASEDDTRIETQFPSDDLLDTLETAMREIDAVLIVFLRSALGLLQSEISTLQQLG